MIHDSNPNHALAELEQLRALIPAEEAHLTMLKARDFELTQYLDKITCPPSRKPTFVWRGFEYRGQVMRRFNYIDIHVDLLRLLWRDFPSRREEMALSISRGGRVRRYVHTSAEGLFENKPMSWVTKYSKPLVDGWHVDTNLNRGSIKRILIAAVRSAGLVWGSDVKVNWKTLVLRPEATEPLLLKNDSTFDIIPYEQQAPQNPGAGI